MSILSTFKKYKDYILTENGYQLSSRWTKSDAVVMGDGTDDTNTLESNLGAIKGITSDLACEDTNVAASMSAVGAALGGFSFTTQDSKDGYMKDGEFHPFGNPYLRYNEDTGYIQALTTSGEWRNVFYTENLPMTCLYLFNNGMLLESLSGLTNLTYAYGTRNYVIEDNMLCPYAKGAGSYNAYGGFITNAPIDLSEYNELHVIAHVNAGTLSFDFIGSKNTAAPTSKLANYITSTTDVEVTVDISELSGEYYFRSSIIGYGNSTTYKGYISQIFLL